MTQLGKMAWGKDYIPPPPHKFSLQIPFFSPHMVAFKKATKNLLFCFWVPAVRHTASDGSGAIACSRACPGAAEASWL